MPMFAQRHRSTRTPQSGARVNNVGRSRAAPKTRRRGEVRTQRPTWRVLVLGAVVALSLPHCARNLEGLGCPCVQGYVCCAGRCSRGVCDIDSTPATGSADSAVTVEAPTLCCADASIGADSSGADASIGGEGNSGEGSDDQTTRASNEGGTSHTAGETQTSNVLSVVGVDPVDGAREVPRTLEVVQITFDQPLDDTTVGPETVSVANGTEVVPTTLAVDGATISVSFLAPLRLFSAYTVNVSRHVSDVTGVSLGREISSSFVTREGGWTLPEVVDDPVGLVGTANPRIGAAANGDVLVLYTLQVEPAPLQSPYARWYRQTSGWEDAVALDHVDTEGCNDVALDVNPMGDALAAWRCGPTVRTRLYKDGSWQPDVYQPYGEAFGPPEAAMLSLGWGFVAFQDTQDALRLEAIGDEGDPTPTHTLGSPEDHTVASMPTLAFDKNGNGLAVWATSTPSLERYPAYGRYTATTHAWVGASPIPASSSALNATQPVVAMDQDGNGMALWVVHSPESVGDLLAIRFTKADGWHTPVRVDTLDDEILCQPKLVFDGTDYVAAYCQSVGLNPNLYHARFSDGEWGAPELASSGAEVVYDVHLATDRRGTSFLAWVDGGPSMLIGAEGDAKLGAVSVRRHSRTTGSWTDISSDPPLKVFGRGMNLAVAADGTASLSYFRFSDGAYHGSPQQFEDLMLTRFE